MLVDNIVRMLALGEARGAGREDFDQLHVNLDGGIAALCRDTCARDLPDLARDLHAGRPRCARCGTAPPVADAAAGPELALGTRRMVVGGEVAKALPDIGGEVGRALTAQLPPILHWRLEVLPAKLTGAERARRPLAALDAARTGRTIETFLGAAAPGPLTMPRHRRLHLTPDPGIMSR